jgi:hypothetical protein
MESGNSFLGYFNEMDRAKLGNASLIVPPADNVGQRGQWMKLFNTSVPDEFADTITISIRSEYALNQPQVSGFGVAPGALPLFGRPLVARIRWGTGGSYNVIDFDVPPPNAQFLAPIGFPGSAPIDDIGSGVTITLSGSAFEVMVRNDGNLSYLVNPGVTEIATPSAKALVRGSLNPDQGHTDRLSRTVFIAGVSGGGSGPPNNPLTVGGAVQMNVPAFAKSVRFPRTPIANTPLTVTLRTNTTSDLSQVQLGPNEEGPIMLAPDAVVIAVANAGAVNVDALQAVFDVTP